MSSTRRPPDELADAYMRDGLWSDAETVVTLLARNAKAQPTRRAVIDTEGGALSYSALESTSANLAGALRRRGIQQGDVVAVQLPNRVEASVVACALARLGAVINPMVPAYRERELAYMTEHCGTRALISPGTYKGFDHDAMASSVADKVESLELLVSLSSRPRDGVEPLSALIAEEPRKGVESRSPDDIAAVLFTSGTESMPKAVTHSSNTLLSNLRSVRRLLELEESDNIFMASPVGHGTGYGFGILLSVLLGSTLVLQDGWDPVEAASLIARYDVGYTHGATPFVQELIELPGVSPGDFPRFRWFVTGGAAVPPGMVSKVRERLGCTLLRLYGQTEGFMTTINRPKDPDEVLESTDGQPAPGVELEIRDDSGEVLPPGEPGEVWYRGPHRCLGFMNDPERTNRAIDEDGWIASGDLCVLNKRGSLTVMGRKKEIINRGGYKYSPRELEDVLSSHPAIQRVAIVSMSDARLGEKGCVFVVPRAGGQLALADITATLEEAGVAKFKWPERLELVDEMPVTASGKIQKYVLERRLTEETLPERS